VVFADEFARGIARSAAVAFDEAFAGTPNSPARRFVGDLIPYANFQITKA
jgi:geranylgeranyl diphosphate synthase type II